MILTSPCRPAQACCLCCALLESTWHQLLFQWATSLSPACCILLQHMHRQNQPAFPALNQSAAAGSPLLGANVSAVLNGYTATDMAMPLAPGPAGAYLGSLDTNKVSGAAEARLLQLKPAPERLCGRRSFLIGRTHRRAACNSALPTRRTSPTPARWAATQARPQCFSLDTLHKKMLMGPSQAQGRALPTAPSCWRPAPTSSHQASCWRTQASLRRRCAPLLQLGCLPEEVHSCKHSTMQHRG